MDAEVREFGGGEVGGRGGGRLNGDEAGEVRREGAGEEADAGEEIPGQGVGSGLPGQVGGCGGDERVDEVTVDLEEGGAADPELLRVVVEIDRVEQAGCTPGGCGEAGGDAAAGAGTRGVGVGGPQELSASAGELWDALAQGIAEVREGARDPLAGDVWRGAKEKGELQVGLVRGSEELELGGGGEPFGDGGRC